MCGVQTLQGLDKKLFKVLNVACFCLAVTTTIVVQFLLAILASMTLLVCDSKIIHPSSYLFTYNSTWTGPLEAI